jgi:hypothetical protein
LVTSLPALRKIGFSTNRRLLDVQRLSHDPAAGTTTLTAITDPVHTDAGQRVAGMRFNPPDRLSPYWVLAGEGYPLDLVDKTAAVFCSLWSGEPVRSGIGAYTGIHTSVPLLGSRSVRPRA